MDDPDSLAAKCSLNCRGGGRPANATPEAGTPENIVTASQPTNEKQDPSKQRLVNESDIGQTPASLAESLKSSGESRHRSLPKMYVSFIVPLLMCLV